MVLDEKSDGSAQHDSFFAKEANLSKNEDKKGDEEEETTDKKGMNDDKSSVGSSSGSSAFHKIKELRQSGVKIPKTLVEESEDLGEVERVHWGNQEDASDNDERGSLNESGLSESDSSRDSEAN